MGMNNGVNGSASNNGDDNGSLSNSSDHNIVAMELESLHPNGSDVQVPRRGGGGGGSGGAAGGGNMITSTLFSLWMLFRLHVEYYPKISSCVGLVLLAFVMYLVVEASKPPLARHKLGMHDYTDIDMEYNFRAAQIDHWCLFGGDDACRCEDFTEPIPRDEIKGWVAAHEANKKRLQPDFDYDVVFLGDDMVELWNGKLFNQDVITRTNQDGPRIKAYFNETFNKDNGGDLDGLALGINGDSSSNLLWRIKHGEMPYNLQSKVWWLWIGTNDLARGGCSEEATVLGILRTAEEIAYHNEGSIVVIMGILPRSSRADGSLESKRHSTKFFGKHLTKEQQADQARREFLLWPSIQAVNAQLEAFCAKHDYMVYFDASVFFLGSVGNEYFKGRRQEIMGDLMPDYVHPSFQGYKVLGDKIHDELIRIIWDEDESNDVEEKDGGRKQE